MAILEVMRREGPSQSPRDRIPWILANSVGKMKRSDLRRRMGMRYADLDPILERPNQWVTPKGRQVLLSCVTDPIRKVESVT